MDDSLCLDILKLLHTDYLAENNQVRDFVSEFSFIIGKGGKIYPKIRILNLIFPKMMIVSDIVKIKQSRMDSIVNILEKLQQEKIILFDLDKIEDLLNYVNKNPEWLLQFGMELGKNGKLRIKIYFGRANREKEELNFMADLVIKIGRIFNAKYNKLAIFPILENNIDAMALDITENGCSLKIYDYFHFPNKEQMDHILKKCRLINRIGEDSQSVFFRKLIEKNKIYGHRNFDTMVTYRFEDNSLELKGVKVNTHLNPHMDAEKLLKKIINKSNGYIFDYLEKGKLKVSFVGNQPDEFFFYVR